MLQLVLAIAACGLVGLQNVGEKAENSTIVVHLPASAQFYIDDFRSTQTGTIRTFITPPLEEGYKYSYTLRIEVRHEGKVFESRKSIKIAPGQTLTLEFADPRPAALPKLPGAADPKPATPDSGLKLSREEQELIDLTNKERADEGKAPLRANATLMQAAKGHSANMARQGKLDHDLDEKSPAERLRELGYRSFNWGENIANGMPTSRQALRVWMDSAGHKANILNDDFNEIGVGIATDERGVRYYTQVFGRR